MPAGARLVSACAEDRHQLRTLGRRGRKAFGVVIGRTARTAVKGMFNAWWVRLARRKARPILLTCNQPEYASLPARTDPYRALADQRPVLSASRISFYADLASAGHVAGGGGGGGGPHPPRSAPPAAARNRESVPRPQGGLPMRFGSWDISFLPTTVRGVVASTVLWSMSESRKVVAMGCSRGGVHPRSQLSWCSGPA